MKKRFVVEGRNEKFQNEQREECIKKGCVPLGYAMVEIVSYERSNFTQRNNQTYRKQKHSKEKEI